MKTMTKKDEIIDLLKDYNKEKDVNHWVRRFARCYFDGSYKEFMYTLNIEFMAKKPTEKEIRSRVINNFVSFIATEFDLAYSSAQRAIVAALSKEDLSLLTDALIVDFKDTYKID